MDRVIHTGRGNLLTIRRPAHGGDVAAMTRVRCDGIARHRIPDLHQLIIAASRQIAPIIRPGHAGQSG